MLIKVYDFKKKIISNIVVSSFSSLQNILVHNDRQNLSENKEKKCCFVRFSLSTTNKMKAQNTKSPFYSFAFLFPTGIGLSIARLITISNSLNPALSKMSTRANNVDHFGTKKNNFHQN